MTTAIKERPILFSGEMVRAILDGRKTQTRRVVKPQPPEGMTVGECCYTDTGWALCELRDDGSLGGCSCDLSKIKCPYGAPGDHLWVRETFYFDLLPWASGGSLDTVPDEERHDELNLYFAADGSCCDQIPECVCAEVGRPRWRPSIHMPRWASRITLEVTGVRVERVQDISGTDARDEGIECQSHLSWQGSTDEQMYPRGFYGEGYAASFRKLWDSINADRGFGWDTNPWVWVVEFKTRKDV